MRSFCPALVMAETLAQNVPTATIHLDRPRRIAFTLGAMRRIKEQTGESITELRTDEAGIMDRLGVYLWAMLVPEDRDGMTPELLEELLHPGNLEAAIAAFGQVVSASTTPAKQGGQARGKAKAERSPAKTT